MTKKYKLRIIILIIISTVFISNVEENEYYIKKINVYYIPWSFNMRGALYKKDFKQYHKVDIQTITDSLLLAEISNRLNNLEIDSFNKGSELDIRMLCEIHFSNDSSITICFNKYKEIQINNHYYLKNNELINLIEENIPKHSYYSSDSYLYIMSKDSSSTKISE